MSGILEGISAFLAAVKQTSPVVLLGLALATGVAIFAGEGFVASLGLAALRNEYRSHLGLAFLGSASLLAAQSAFSGARVAREKWRAHLIRRLRRRNLDELTPDEKAYLAPFVLQHQNTQYHTLQDGVAAGLVAKNILFLPSTMGRELTGFAHNIQPWAKEHLLKHPELLAGANPDPEGPPTLW